MQSLRVGGGNRWDGQKCTHTERFCPQGGGQGGDGQKCTANRLRQPRSPLQCRRAQCGHERRQVDGSMRHLRLVEEHVRADVSFDDRPRRLVYDEQSMLAGRRRRGVRPVVRSEPGTQSSPSGDKRSTAGVADVLAVSRVTRPAGGRLVSRPPTRHNGRASASRSGQLIPCARRRRPVGPGGRDKPINVTSHGAIGPRSERFGGGVSDCGAAPAAASGAAAVRRRGGGGRGFPPIERRARRSGRPRRSRRLRAA